MLFSDNECRELAAFFAKRFSEPSVRSMLARQAGIKEDDEATEPAVAWERLITTAQNRRKLPKLAIVAAKTDSTDQNLQAVCNLLGARSRIIRNRAIGIAAAACLAATFGIAGFNLGTDDADQALAAIETTPTADAVIEDVTVADIAVVEEAEEVIEVVEAAEPTGPAYTTLHTPPDERPNGPAWRNGRCTYSKEGDFVGYWYAGAELPGRQGDVVEVKMGVNVRMDYPGRHNDFNTRAKVRCILKRGDKVKLTDSAILVPPDKYWVPIYHGDLVEEAPEENLVAVR